MERNNKAKQNSGLSQMNGDSCPVLQNMMNSVLCFSRPLNGRKKKATNQNHRTARQWHLHSYSVG